MPWHSGAGEVSGRGAFERNRRNVLRKKPTSCVLETLALLETKIVTAQSSLHETATTRCLCDTAHHRFGK